MKNSLYIILFASSLSNTMESSHSDIKDDQLNLHCVQSENFYDYLNNEDQFASINSSINNYPNTTTDFFSSDQQVTSPLTTNFNKLTECYVLPYKNGSEEEKIIDYNEQEHTNQYNYTINCSCKKKIISTALFSIKYQWKRHYKKCNKQKTRVGAANYFSTHISKPEYRKCFTIQCPEKGCTRIVKVTEQSHILAHSLYGHIRNCHKSSKWNKFNIPTSLREHVIKEQKVYLVKTDNKVKI